MAESEKVLAPDEVLSEESENKGEDIVSFTTSDQETTIRILRHYCKGCEICAEVCPKGVLRMVEAIDRWEGSLVEVIDINACNACMLCEHQCPDFAIEVYNVKKERKKKEKQSIA